MKLEEIYAEWEKDSEIDITKIDREAISVAKIHNKYLRELSSARFELAKQEADFKIIKKIKTEYYSGTLDIETLKERHYKPLNLRILRSDVSTYLESDEELIQLSLKIAVANEKVEALKSIIGILKYRGMDIKNYIDYVKFQAGA